MRVSYTGFAREELHRLLEALASASPLGARRVAKRIKNVERLLARFPEAGSPTRLPWLRRVKTSAYPYLIFYELTNNEILIHAVRHGARQPFDEIDRV